MKTSNDPFEDYGYTPGVDGPPLPEDFVEELDSFTEDDDEDLRAFEAGHWIKRAKEELEEESQEEELQVDSHPSIFFIPLHIEW